MAFDSQTRNKLQRMVGACRRLLADEFDDQLQGLYGIYAQDGRVLELEKLTSLDDDHHQTATLLRDRITHLTSGMASEKQPLAEAVRRVLREQAFTLLNRFAALRMAEERGFVQECVGQGLKSKGFQVFETVARSGLGGAYERYVTFIHGMFDELSLDLGVLFNRWSPFGLLFPREPALLKFFDLLNDSELKPLWKEDETIGWIYQHFNDEAERKKMREESAAPRNSRELAVRNQFFTPRYVVEFLTDNTLGRIWYEMAGGRTALKEKCHYLVRRPTEVFLAGPAEVYRHLFRKDADAEDMKPHGWVAQAFTGHLKDLPENPGDPDTRWVGSAIRPADFEKLAGEACPAFEDHRLSGLCKAVLEGRESDDTQNLLLVWATLSDFTRCDGSRGYSAPHWEKLWSHFRKLAQRPIAENRSQEDLLKQPVFIPQRPIKDPRTILMLDPACGSMHFGLYAFDLFEVIYDEAWELEKLSDAEFQSRPPGMLSLQETYGTKEDFLKDVPRLIIEHNLHGIDIDPRCAQIAGLSLWLRAQKAWQRLGLKPAERPAIKRSNIVCAEPMPGEKELLREFVEREFPAEERGVCLRLLEAIFDKMQLAGEAGSLLKIEEEIRSAIEDARRQWQTARQRPEFFDAAQLAALDTRAGAQQELPAAERASMTAGLRSLTSEDFWERIEERIYAALRDYAEQAENGGGFQRRLFAEDAARGFAFIDVCRKRYDVALMNPPFGDPPERANRQLQRGYLAVKHDLASAFLERGRQFLCDQGLLGCISTRTLFFLSYLGEWREQFFLRHCGIHLFCDLGVGVLDAMVETAMYTIGSHVNGPPVALFLKVSDVDDRSSLLDDLVRGFHPERLNERIFVCDPLTFRHIPKSPFAYWVPDKIRNLFSELPPFETPHRHGHIGALSQDDFRFVRLWWEVPTQLIGADWTAGTTFQWVPYTKGGTFAPYYMDIPALLKWEEDGEELKAFLVAYRQEKGFADQWTGQLNAYDLYFSQGLTWSSRPLGQGSFWVMPKGCIFRHSAPAIVDVDSDALFFDLAIMNSLHFRFLLDLLMPRGSAGTATLKYELGYVRSVPVPMIPKPETDALTALAKDTTKLLMTAYRPVEEAHLFVSPSLDSSASLKARLGECQERASGIQQLLALKTTQIDTLIQRFYSMDGEIGRNLLRISNVKPVSESVGSYELWREWSSDSEVRAIISYLYGATLGRWDIRYATGEEATPDLPDPFAPLPVCPPGQLQNAQGLPARPEDVPAAYPIRIPWDGILVDDPNHPLDVERRIREVIEIIWKDRAEAIEHEACEILGVKSLRDFFRKPAGCFSDHLQRYSKSRRQAPIYWPLSTASGGYTLWIYYHRLTDQTLFQCVNDFVKPKLEEVNRDIERLRGELQRANGGSSKQRETLEELEDFTIELKEFHDELLRVAGLPYKPNLNDGVLITASPLWKLFRLPKWQKDLKACWEALEGEDYEWAHLAYTIWPDRVKKVCKRDRSIAIAHGLEGLCYVKAPEKKAKRGKKKTEQMELEGGGE